MYPDESLQSFVGEWWVEDHSKTYQRGQLIWAFLSHVDQIPNQLIAVGRSDPRDHSRADVQIKPLRIKQPPSKPKLPVAALPAFGNEVNIVCRAKKRPALIICAGGDAVEKKLTRGQPKYQTAPTILVAPFYGIEEGLGKRAGFNPEFIARVQQCEYPQYVWDILPIGGSTSASLLRLDHIQPIGKHHDSIELTDFRLSDDALQLMDEWLDWLIYGDFAEDSLLLDFKQGIKEI